MELPDGTTIGLFTSIDQIDVGKETSKQVGAVRHTRETWEILKHLEAMFKQICKECAMREQEGQLADLLTQHEAVFSKNDQDV